MGRRATGIAILILCLVYIAARMWRLGDSCLWFDEVFSVHAAEHDWGSLFRFVAQDLIHPPLFYIVLKSWIGLGGESVLWLRLLPVLFSILALFPFVRLARELKFSTPVMLVSLGLLAVNGALIKYTQTVRMYSMLMFLALMSMWLFARYFNRGKSFTWLVIANVLLVYTHYFGWLVIASEIIVLLAFQRIKWRRAVGMLSVVSISFVPWLIAVLQAAAQGSDIAQNIGWQKRPGIRELIMFTTDLVEPFYFQASSAEPASIYVVSTPLLLIAIAMLALYFVEWKNQERKTSVYVLFVFVLVPFIVAFVASWILPHSVWGTRHLILLFPPAMILIANAVWSFPVRVVSYTAVALIIVFTGLGLARDVGRKTPQHVWCGWERAAADIRSKDPSGKIYAFENLVAYHLWFALRKSDRPDVAVVKGIDVRTDDETYFLPRGFDAVGRVSINDIADENIWLALRTTVPGEDELVMREFTQRGYQVCSTDRSDYGSTSIYWMRLSKAGCR
jgi:4-amino-4-deoxy-L-arabinose transferase-like glycosyltransferase